MSRFTRPLVGYGAVLLTEQSNLDVMVHPEWQRRGVGRMLWEQMRQDLPKLGTVTLGPWVRAANTVGCAWIEAMGFTHAALDRGVPHGIGGKALRLRWNYPSLHTPSNMAANASLPVATTQQCKI